MNKKQGIILLSYACWLVVIAFTVLSDPAKMAAVSDYLLALLLLPAIFILILYRLLK